MSIKERKKAVAYAEANGFVTVRTKNHIVMKRGKHTISISSSASDGYGYANAIRDVNKAIKDIKDNK